MRRLTLVPVLLMILSAPAYADDVPIGTTVSPKGDPVVYVTSPGTDPTGVTGSGSVTCGLYDLVGTPPGTSVWSLGVQPESNPVEGKSYLLICYSTADGTIELIQFLVYQPGVSVITPGMLAEQALKELPLLYPRPRLAPPTTAKQVVGIRTWMWVDPNDWHAISATAAIPGLSATVTATPTKTIWDMGDGTTVTCNGPGTPYDNAKSDAGQHSSCTHVYEHDGARNVRVSMEWTVTWTASNGAGGNLGTFRRSTQFPVNVEQRQAVITG